MNEEHAKGVPVQVSKHYQSISFDCHCHFDTCKVTYLDTDLLDYLEKKSDLFLAPIRIISGFRCVQHNRDVGGKIGSIHLIGKAADIQIHGYDMIKIADQFEDSWGLGRYPGRHFLHCDVRGYKARWTG